MRSFSRTRDRVNQCNIPELFDGTCKAPQFPVDTEVALVRQAMLIDVTGQPMVSPIVESIQLRRYRSIAKNDQQFAEYRLSQRALLAGESSLRRVGEEEKDFLTFHSHGLDAFESSSPEARFFEGAALQNVRFAPTHTALGCSSCHQSSGVGSFTSYSRAQFARPKDMFVMVHASTEVQENDAAVRAVKSRPVWETLVTMIGPPHDSVHGAMQ